jgi:Asp-tRNA(Asn)/Glu-tRNA(Gln) amidotransferase A subunit family amidase
MSELAELCMRPLCEVAELIARRALSLVELTKAELSRIEALDKKLHSYLLVTAGPALAQARRAEQEIAAGGYRGKLHGMPVAVKDLVHMKEVPTTCASTILRGFRPGYDAAVVEKLAAVAVILGKLNLTEFALYGYHPEYEYPRNPWNLDYWAGASSSGSGVATAAGLCFAADYGPVFRAWLEYASRVTAAAHARGEVMRQTTRALFEKIFTEADCPLCPAMAAPPQSQFRPDQVMPPEELARLIRFAGPSNYTGSPSIMVPNGFTAEGLPTAMQLIGRHGDEATLIRAAGSYERATDWHLRRPPLQVEKG